MSDNEQELEDIEVLAGDEPQEALAKGWKELGEQAQRKQTQLNTRIPLINIDFVKLAEQYINNVQPLYFDRARNWWLWDSKAYRWERIDETDVLNLVKKTVVTSGLTSNNIKTQLIEALRLEARAYAPKETSKEWVQFGNVIHDLKTGEDFFATPKYFLTNPIPWKPSNSDKTPYIDRLFTEWVTKPGDDKKAVERKVTKLYEILAYCCLPDYPLHRVFLFIGAGRNGKGTYLTLIERFVGARNTTSTELEALLLRPFETAKLYKKLVVMIGETNFTKLSNTNKLKRLSGGDLVSFEFKNKDAIDAHNYAKILIATNSLPVTDDKTDGFYSRMDITDFPNRFSEKSEVLSKIPLVEWNNLAYKTLKVLKRLLREREFTNEGTIEERRERYEARSNPLQLFIKENIEENVDSYIFKFDFEQRFNDYCKEHGFRQWSQQALGRELKKQYGYEDGRRPSPKDSNKRWTTWESLSWRSVTDVTDVNDTSIEIPIRETNRNYPDNPDNPDKGFLSRVFNIQSRDEKLVKGVCVLLKHKGAMPTEEILKYNPHLTEEHLRRAREQGLIFEPRSGWWKVLE